MNENFMNRFNKLLKTDEDFRKKFYENFSPDQIIAISIFENRYEGMRSCSCYPGLCGRGCFAGHLGDPHPWKGETVG